MLVTIILAMNQILTLKFNSLHVFIVFFLFWSVLSQGYPIHIIVEAHILNTALSNAGNWQSSLRSRRIGWLALIAYVLIRPKTYNMCEESNRAKFEKSSSLSLPIIIINNIVVSLFDYSIHTAHRPTADFWVGCGLLLVNSQSQKFLCSFEFKSYNKEILAKILNLVVVQCNFKLWSFSSESHIQKSSRIFSFENFRKISHTLVTARNLIAVRVLDFAWRFTPWWLLLGRD